MEPLHYINPLPPICHYKRMGSLQAQFYILRIYKRQKKRPRGGPDRRKSSDLGEYQPELLIWT
jgi:hypothetical protein